MHLSIRYEPVSSINKKTSKFFGSVQELLIARRSVEREEHAVIPCSAVPILAVEVTKWSGRRISISRGTRKGSSAEELGEGAWHQRNSTRELSIRAVTV
ncbi:hypothetical protein U1Q18_001515 [Sarracenia purpurea var. burkii]